MPRSTATILTFAKSAYKMPLSEPFLYYILIGAGAVGVFLLLREFNCWYWKINQRLALLEEILARLERLEQQQLSGEKPGRSRLPDITID